MSTEAIENCGKISHNRPANVCPLEIAIINQQTPWTAPVIPFKRRIQENKIKKENKMKRFAILVFRFSF